jgi:hypothetical protein
MGDRLSLLQLFLLERYETRGALLCAVALLLFVLLPQRLRTTASGLLDYRHDRVAKLLIAALAFAGLAYLAYPNYFDHVESTVAWLGLVLQRGAALYPAPDRYPYDGVLYGPGLALSQLPVAALHLPELVGSKLPGLIAFLVSALIMFHVSRSRLSRGYLLYLLPFGIELFFVRAEPLLLLLVCITLLLARLRPGRTSVLIVSGLLAGLASAVKLHGALYVLAAWLAVNIELGLSASALLIFGASAAVAFAACFLPPNVSFNAFVGYLRLAGNHGLLLELWLENVLYFLFLAIPLTIVWRENRPARTISINLSLILAAEFLLTVIAAKPGAGTHHFLPLIPVNAYLIYKLRPDDGARASPLIKLIYFMLVVAAVPFALATGYSMAKDWRHFKEAGREVAAYHRKYPGIVMGASDLASYKYIYLRVLLGAGQIDYPAYMDLQVSGVTDQSMAARMNSCAIGALLIPVNGAAFSLNNYYTGKPLFSDDIRTAFELHYSLVENGGVYAVYSCHDPTVI